MKSCIAWVVALAVLGAAGSEAPTITVRAMGTIKVAPTALQVWVTVKDKGPDAAGALEALKGAKEKLATKLAGLGVKADQIKSDLPTVIDKAAAEALKAQRTGGRLKRKTATEEKPEVEMQQVLRALIPLTAKEPDALFVEAEAVKAKVKAAKLVDEKAEAAEGDEDENMGRYYDRQRQESLVFAFYAPHNDELRSQAMADALKKANESATRAAKAMGKSGVELHSLNVGADGGDETSQYQYNNYNRYGRSVEMPTVDDGSVSQTPQMMVYAQVTAVFHVK